MDDRNLYWAELIERYLLHQCSEQQRKELEVWVKQSPENQNFFKKICSQEFIRQKWNMRESIDVRAAIHRFDRKIVSGRTLKMRCYTIGVSVAAAVIAIMFIVPLLQKAPDRIIQPLFQNTVEVLPGSTKAVLKLENGNVFELAECDSVRLEKEAGLSITHKGKTLDYQICNQSSELYVPRGGEYTLMLADGSVVHLNSGTTLKFPATFDLDKREVELYGEAYFEIVRDEARPFLVRTTGMTVQVYGTSFNVNTHKAERIQTALISGKVGIIPLGSSNRYFLEPSQLAEFNSETGKMVIREVDLSPYVSWTNGVFTFESMSLEDIMETLSLWYDVEVFFAHASIKQLHFTGSLSRYSPLSVILETIAQTVGIKIQQKERTIIIE